MAGLFDGTPLERAVTCGVCGTAEADCGCPRDADGAVCRPADQAARVRRERRRGKWVTVVSGLDPAASDRAALLREAKKLCSAGGAATADGFEVQGDHRDRLVAVLRERGYPAKPAGG
ncbi:MAG: translation initiation factor [Planctomycetota bacterium]